MQNCKKPPAREITSEGQIKHWQTTEICYSINDMKDTGLWFVPAGSEFSEGCNFNKISATQTLFQMMLGDFYFGEANTTGNE